MKNECIVDYQETIQLKDGDRTETYELQGVVQHTGGHDYGHYYAFVKKKKLWYSISDADVRLTNELNRAYGGEFLLVYRHIHSTPSVSFLLQSMQSNLAE